MTFKIPEIKKEKTEEKLPDFNCVICGNKFHRAGKTEKWGLHLCEIHLKECITFIFKDICNEDMKAYIDFFNQNNKVFPDGKGGWKVE